MPVDHINNSSFRPVITGRDEVELVVDFAPLSTRDPRLGSQVHLLINGAPILGAEVIDVRAGTETREENFGYIVTIPGPTTVDVHLLLKNVRLTVINSGAADANEQEDAEPVEARRRRRTAR